jgi:magnesium transporter
MIFILWKNDIVFTFLSSDIENSLNWHSLYIVENTKFENYHQLFSFQIGVISDYYADIVELISKKIKDLSKNTPIETVQGRWLDYIAELRFNNLLIRSLFQSFREYSSVKKEWQTYG